MTGGLKEHTGGEPNSKPLRGGARESAAKHAPERNSSLRETSIGGCFLTMYSGAVRATLLGILTVFPIMPYPPAQPPNPKQLFQEAMEAEKRGDYAAAINGYQQLLQSFPGAVEVRVNLGGALAASGRFDEAVTQFQTALKRFPDKPEIRMNLALVLHQKGDLAGAAEELKSLLRGHPQDARAAVLLGDCESRLGRVGDAIAALKGAEPANPGDLDLAWELGRALIHAGRLAEGVTRIEKVCAAGGHADAESLAAQTRLRLDEYDQALKHADTLLRLDPSYKGAHTLRGMALEHIGDYATAKSELEAALRASETDADAHLYLGAIELFERNLDAARQNLDAAAALDRNSAAVAYQLGMCKKAQGQIEDAIKDLEEAGLKAPGWRSPHIELAALYYRLGRAADGARERQKLATPGAADRGAFTVPVP